MIDLFWEFFVRFELGDGVVELGIEESANAFRKERIWAVSDIRWNYEYVRPCIVG